MPARDTSLLFAWRDAVFSACGPETSTERLVAAALAQHMDAAGGSCFPSVSRLAEETSLSRRTVQRALRSLEESGWIREAGWETHQTAGGPQRTKVFRAAVPTSSDGGDTVTPPSSKGASLCPKGASETTQGGVTVTPEVVSRSTEERCAHAHEGLNGNGGRPSSLQPCPNDWCDALVPALELARHVRSCRPPDAAGTGAHDTLDDAIRELELVPTDRRPR